MKELLKTSQDVHFWLTDTNEVMIEKPEAGMFLSIPTTEARILIFKNKQGDEFIGVVSALFCCVHVSVEEAESLHEMLPDIRFESRASEDELRRREQSRLAKKWLGKNCLILDTETTGLGEDAEVVEISIIDAQGNTLLNSLVKPSKPIPADATAVHGITNEMVSGAPAWDQLHKQFADIMSNKEQPLIIYNDSYDMRVLNQTARIYGIRPAYFTSSFVRNCESVYCAMLAYAEFYGEWDNYRNAFKWQKLTNAVKQCGLEVENAHRSLSDCRMTLQVLQFMAANGCE